MKVPKARKLKSGTWFIQLRIKGKSYTVTADTKNGCETQALIKKAELMSQSRRLPTLEDAIDEYCEKRSNVLSPATIEAYLGIKKSRFQSIMQTPLDEIKDTQALVNEEAETVSAKTLKNAYSLISSVCRENGVILPSVQLPQRKKTEHAFLQPEQIPVFIRIIEGEEYELPMLLALHGLRRSEIFGLTKKDIQNGYIHIRGGMVRDKDRHLVQNDVNKTYASQRDVPILIERVNVLVKECKTEKIYTGAEHSLYRRVNKICRDNGLPEIGLHGCRHSFASLCYHLKLSEETTMRLGGWNSPEVMRKIYTHLAEKDKNEAVDKLKGFFVSKSVSKSTGKSLPKSSKKLPKNSNPFPSVASMK